MIAWGIVLLLAGFLVLVFGVMLLMGLNALICWLLADVLKRIPECDRAVSPTLPWFLMIPVFHLVWNFVVFRGVSHSLQNHFRRTGRLDVEDCGAVIGLCYSASLFLWFIPVVNYAGIRISLIFLMMTLGRFHRLKKEIIALPEAADV